MTGDKKHIVWASGAPLFQVYHEHQEKPEDGTCKLPGGIYTESELFALDTFGFYLAPILYNHLTDPTQSLVKFWKDGVRYTIVPMHNDVNSAIAINASLREETLLEMLADMAAELNSALGLDDEPSPLGDIDWTNDDDEESED